jgi:hypothetical protein
MSGRGNGNNKQEFEIYEGSLLLEENDFFVYILYAVKDMFICCRTNLRYGTKITFSPTKQIS